jgi:hypothetical protein
MRRLHIPLMLSSIFFQVRRDNIWRPSGAHYRWGPFPGLHPGLRKAGAPPRAEPLRPFLARKNLVKMSPRELSETLTFCLSPGLIHQESFLSNFQRALRKSKYLEEGASSWSFLIRTHLIWPHSSAHLTKCQTGPVASRCRRLRIRQVGRNRPRELFSACLNIARDRDTLLSRFCLSHRDIAQKSRAISQPPAVLRRRTTGFAAKNVSKMTWV